MVPEEKAETTASLDEVMEDIRGELGETILQASKQGHILLNCCELTQE